MNIRTAIITATTAAALASGGVAIAGATSSRAPESSAPSSVATAAGTGTPNVAPATHAKRHLKIRRAIRRAAARVVIETIGIDRKALRTDLLAGKTIADIASAHGVAPQAVVNAIVAAVTTRLDGAVESGRITTARAQRIEQRLPARVTKIVNAWHPKRARSNTP